MISYALETLAVSGADQQESIQEQLISYVPVSWTSGEAKLRGGVFWALMGGLAALLAIIRAEIDTFLLQLRLATAFAGGLDAISQDFFGTDSTTALPRALTPASGVNQLEDDFSYRGRIRAELLQPRATIRGVTDAVTAVTGAAPTIVEPFSTQSAAVYGQQNNPNQLRTGISNNLSTETKLYVTSKTGFIAQQLVEVYGLKTGGGALTTTVTSTGTDGNGDFLVVSPALAFAPGLGYNVGLFATTLTTGSTTTVLNLAQADATGYAVNDEINVAGFRTLSNIAPIITSISTNQLTISPALTSAPGSTTVVANLGKPVNAGYVGSYSNSAGRQDALYLTTTSGSTTTTIKVPTTNVKVGDLIAILGFTPTFVTVTSIIDPATLTVLPALNASPGTGVPATVSEALGNGADAFGDAGVRFTFIVNVTNNPRGASAARIRDVVERVRPVGVRGIVNVAA